MQKHSLLQTSLHAIVAGVLFGLTASTTVLARTFVEDHLARVQLLVSQQQTELGAGPIEVGAAIQTADTIGRIVNNRPIDVLSLLTELEKAGCLACFNAVKNHIVDTETVSDIPSPISTKTPAP